MKIAKTQLYQTAWLIMEFVPHGLRLRVRFQYGWPFLLGMRRKKSITQWFGQIELAHSQFWPLSSDSSLNQLSNATYSFQIRLQMLLKHYKQNRLYPSRTCIQKLKTTLLSFMDKICLLKASRCIKTSSDCIWDELDDFRAWIGWFKPPQVLVMVMKLIENQFFN